MAVGRLGVDRRRDLAGWLLAPLYTLVGAPVLAGCVGMIVVGLESRRPPEFCAEARLDNRCEEATLAMLAGHAVLFAAIWLLLWLVPWWRGLRILRILLAVLAAVVLVLAPIRMA